MQEIWIAIQVLQIDKPSHVMSHRRLGARSLRPLELDVSVSLLFYPQDHECLRKCHCGISVLGDKWNSAEQLRGQPDLIGHVLSRGLVGPLGAFSSLSYSMNFYGEKYLILCSYIACIPCFMKC